MDVVLFCLVLLIGAVIVYVVVDIIIPDDD